MRAFKRHTQPILFATLLVLAVSSCIKAEPLPEPAKGRDTSASLRPQYRAAAIDEPLDVEVNAGNQTDASSSGRLFMKKFLLFKNMFGANQQQPIIPIIMAPGTGGTTTTTTTGGSPTTTQTVTTTGTVPTASGTIITTPTTNDPSGVGSRSSIDEEEEAAEEDAEPQQADEAAILDEQALQSALVAGAQEYVVTNEEIRGTNDAKASKQPARINLRRRGVNSNPNKSQVISIRVPAQYRRYFKRGQKVMLNTNSANRQRRPGNKRIIRKRVNKNRRKKVNRPQRGANKKRIGTRIIAA